MPWITKENVYFCQIKSIHYCKYSAYLKIVSLTDDHSRVILESTENGDYINANFIKVCN